MGQCARARAADISALEVMQYNRSFLYYAQLYDIRNHGTSLLLTSYK